MVKRRRTVGLIGFLKGSTNPAEAMPGCANYDHYHGGCLFAEHCKVEQGQRCGYFEQAVLPTAADIGLREQVYRLYEQQVRMAGKGLLAGVAIRKCPVCGAELKPRRRYCSACAERRRRENRRHKRQKLKKRAG